MSLTLNIAQERELRRLIEYERSTCSVNNDLVYRVAFPYRPDNDLQVELIEAGALATKDDSAHGTVVVITSEGYSYFPALAREQRKEKEQNRREAHLMGLTALFSALCMLAGFLLGYIVR